MPSNHSKHVNYEVLNLIGYGLAKFDKEFIKEFGFTTKSAFYDYCVQNGVADTIGTIKNRMDLFDFFFPENKRKGWWQKGNAYIHRKDYIDALFGGEDAEGFAKVVKLYLREELGIETLKANENPIFVSRFRQMQKTGLAAEMYFIANYQSVDIFHGGVLEDARLYGDGYDFQIKVHSNYYLAEVKGVRGEAGGIRMTENEYRQASKFGDDYILSVVMNLTEIPYFKLVRNPIKNLEFRQITKTQKTQIEYQLISKLP